MFEAIKKKQAGTQVELGRNTLNNVSNRISDAYEDLLSLEDELKQRNTADLNEIERLQKAVNARTEEITVSQILRDQLSKSLTVTEKLK